MCGRRGWQHASSSTEAIALGNGLKQRQPHIPGNESSPHSSRSVPPPCHATHTPVEPLDSNGPIRRAIESALHGGLSDAKQETVAGVDVGNEYQKESDSSPGLTIPFFPSDRDISSSSSSSPPISLFLRQALTKVRRDFEGDAAFIPDVACGEHLLSLPCSFAAEQLEIIRAAQQQQRSIPNVPSSNKLLPITDSGSRTDYETFSGGPCEETGLVGDFSLPGDFSCDGVPSDAFRDQPSYVADWASDISAASIPGLSSRPQARALEHDPLPPLRSMPQCCALTASAPFPGPPSLCASTPRQITTSCWPTSRVATQATPPCEGGYCRSDLVEQNLEVEISAPGPGPGVPVPLNFFELPEPTVESHSEPQAEAKHRIHSAMRPTTAKSTQESGWVADWPLHPNFSLYRQKVCLPAKRSSGQRLSELQTTNKSCHGDDQGAHLRRQQISQGFQEAAASSLACAVLRQSAGAAASRSDEAVKLFVNRVPKWMADDQLREVFSPHGTVLECNILKDAKGPKGCAFVKFANLEGAQRAILKLHGRHTLVPNGHPIQIKYAEGEIGRLGLSPEMQPGGEAVKVFVGCVPKTCHREELEALFMLFGRVDEVYVLQDNHNRPKCSAFVTFPRMMMAQKAIQALNGMHYCQGASRPLEVRLAESRQERNRSGATPTASPQASNSYGTAEKPVARSLPPVRQRASKLQRSPVQPDDRVRNSRGANALTKRIDEGYSVEGNALVWCCSDYIGGAQLHGA